MDQSSPSLTESELEAFGSASRRVLEAWTPPMPTAEERALAGQIAAMGKVLEEMDQLLSSRLRARASQAEGKAARHQAKAAKQLAKAKRSRGEAALTEARNAETLARVRANGSVRGRGGNLLRVSV